jgi:hypothetical protein
MKKVWIFCMAMVGALTACDSDSDTRPSGVSVAVGDVNSSYKVLEDAYKNLRILLPGEELKKIRNASGDDYKIYLAMVLEQSDKAFMASVKNHEPEQAAIYMHYEGIKGNATAAMGMDDPEGYFLKLIQKKLDEASMVAGGIPLFNSVVDVNGRPMEDVPSESISLNFSKVEIVLQALELGINSSAPIEEALGEMANLVIQSGVPPVAISLLLPAVQKAREAAQANKADEAFIQWAEEEIVPVVQGALDRDLIRRKVFWEDMGALYAVLLQKYPRENQREAAYALMKDRFDSRVMALVMEYWNEDAPM